ncbi:ABC transporter permease [Bacillus sp. S/N-304-OC-R1]|uniref:ABC transporter permease n=1 Tax=Bacillus sp. S/N-304-OC-R1 TaxID=2758034 RepID=UPI001C8EC062|nr:ABC transporter permease [Bacillus sp. S/N-304-OC-R1]MBY0122772.1 ABC transporter permease [Bacillus sp. S/N-304-OC-R1]
MTFRQLILSNIKGNFQKYSSYFLSSTFTVCIFYLFSAFIFHPSVKGQKINELISVLLIACEIVIVFFTVFFVIYSNSAFMKSRKKEFGLLKLIGLENKQIERLVFFEFTVISIGAIGAGTLFGILFSKLFFMGINAILQLEFPITFTVPQNAVLTTLIVFFVLFELITFLGLRDVRKSEIIELVNASKKPKEPPAYSRMLIILGFVLLIGGYALAAVSNLVILFFSMIPILVLVIFGTYLLFGQISTAILDKLKNSSLYWKKTNMTTISMLVFKMRDNTRILSIAAILSAVVTSSMGILIWFNHFSGTALRGPQDMIILQKGLDEKPVYTSADIEAAAHKHKVEIKHYYRTIILPSTFTLRDSTQSMWIMSESDFNKRAKQMKHIKPLQLEPEKAILVAPFDPSEDERFRPPLYEKDFINIQFNRESKKIAIQDSIAEVTTIRGQNSSNAYLLVIDDKVFENWANLFSRDEQLVIHDYYFGDLENAESLMEELIAGANGSEKNIINGFATYLYINIGNNLLLFIGLFISMLFFLASGSLIFFKLMTEIEEDKQGFSIMRKLGMSEQEVKRTVSFQMAILFFLPVVVGTVHTLFAFNSARVALMATTIWYTGIIAIGLYILFQFAYFFITRSIYIRRLLR